MRLNYPASGGSRLRQRPHLPSAPVAHVEPAAVSPTALRDRLAHLRGSLPAEMDVRENEPLAPYTTFKIGGRADLFVEAHSADELALAVTAAREHEVPLFLLGLGANILVGDLGFRGVVIRNRAAHVEVDAASGRVVAESGTVVWERLIEATVQEGLSGLEHYAGIPSSVGGALWQNLHFLSPDRSRTMFIEEVVESAELLMEDGSRQTVGHDWFEFGYDYSTLHVRPNVIALGATFRLDPLDPSELRQRIDANLQWRGERHPPLATEPSAGSIFKKIDGVGAGRLADWCGMKGTRIGGAEVTQRHANILINRDGASARDVRHLIGYIQETVEREQGYRLSTEIGMIGEFGPLGDLPAHGWENADGFDDGVPPGGHPEAHADAERR